MTVMARMRPTGRADQCRQLGVKLTQRGRRLWAVHDPMYGPAARCKNTLSSIWRMCGLASMYPAFDWSPCRLGRDRNRAGQRVNLDRAASDTATRGRALVTTRSQGALAAPLYRGDLEWLIQGRPVAIGEQAVG